jgi:hypothetical protein
VGVKQRLENILDIEDFHGIVLMLIVVFNVCNQMNLFGTSNGATNEADFTKEE